MVARRVTIHYFTLGAGRGVQLLLKIEADLSNLFRTKYNADVCHNGSNSQGRSPQGQSATCGGCSYDGHSPEVFAQEGGARAGRNFLDNRVSGDRLRIYQGQSADSQSVLHALCQATPIRRCSVDRPCQGQFLDKSGVLYARGLGAQ